MASRVVMEGSLGWAKVITMASSRVVMAASRAVEGVMVVVTDSVLQLVCQS